MRKEILLIFYCSFFLIPLIPEQVLNMDQMSDQWIEVTVRGEVSEEQKIRCPSYSQFKDIRDQICFLPDADLSVYSENTMLKDGDVLTIPAKTVKERISVNTATVEQLCEIPGVGESTALKILDYREKEGLFHSLEDLMKVPGIKQKKWEKMKEYICL